MDMTLLLFLPLFMECLNFCEALIAFFLRDAIIAFFSSSEYSALDFLFSS
jgi:hypothetical protein